jgi:hypothetical protein
MLKLAKILAVSALTIQVASIGFLTVAALDTYHYEVQTTTTSGDLYISGSGTTCSEAWMNVVIPTDWLEIKCIGTY